MSIPSIYRSPEARIQSNVLDDAAADLESPLLRNDVYAGAGLESISKV